MRRARRLQQLHFVGILALTSRLWWPADFCLPRRGSGPCAAEGGHQSSWDHV